MSILRLVGFAVAIIVTGFAVAVVALLVIAPAQAHDVYTGLKNKSGYDCCGDKDCHPISANRVVAHTAPKRGYKIDNFYWVDEDRALPSMDQQFHMCRTDWDVICFFVPFSAM